MRLRDRIYHLKMTLKTLNDFKFPNKGDTRNYLDVDIEECEILKELIIKELEK